jgi:AraC-like DNA-binding protein
MKLESMITLYSPPFPYLIEVGKTLYEPGEQHPNRSHLGVFDLIFVQSGKLFIGEENREWEVRSGQSLILLPDGYHYAVKPCEEESVFYWIHFQTTQPWQEMMMVSDSAISESQTTSELNAGLTNEASYKISIPKYWTVPDCQETSDNMQRLVDLSTQSRSHSFWERQQIFVELLKMMDEGRKETNGSPALVVAEKTEAFIKRNYRSEVTNHTLSEILHFHPNYIARCMKEVYQCTPMEYLVYYRLEQSKLLLLKTDWSISRIAEETGFQYTPYFSKCFREKYAVTPLQFRKRYAR